jgi:hypothetical protein
LAVLSLAKRVGHYLKAMIDHNVSESDRAIKVGGEDDLGILLRFSGKGIVHQMKSRRRLEV